jgi:hypothetical protein
MINFVFEDVNLFQNFVNSIDYNEERFTTSPLFVSQLVLMDKNRNFSNLLSVFDIKKKPNKYIIAIGVHNDPSHWVGGNYCTECNNTDNLNPIPSLFNFINTEYLSDLRNKNAFLLVDNSFEGYHNDCIFTFFHSECERNNIPPSQIIFVTGNSIIESCYKNWLLENPKDIHINVIPYSHFEHDIFYNSKQLLYQHKLPTFKKQINYKRQNYDNIKLFVNLNKKTREHRIWFYAYLYHNDLLNKGLVSMNKFNIHHRYYCNTHMSVEFIEEFYKTLPSLIYNKSNEIEDTGYYINRLNEQTTLDSWISVISEAQFEDEQKTLFLSEKTFKPIACHQPFMIVGNKHSLLELKKMGYETFSNWIDESYDSLDNLKRMQAIIDNLKYIDNIENKLDWYSDMKSVLLHNFEVLKYNTSKKISNAFIKLIEIYEK